MEDFKAAVSYLTTLDDVESDWMGLLGICAAGSYSPAATGGDHRVKAVATVSTAEPARQFRLGADGTPRRRQAHQLLRHPPHHRLMGTS